MRNQRSAKNITRLEPRCWCLTLLLTCCSHLLFGQESDVDALNAEVDVLNDEIKSEL